MEQNNPEKYIGLVKWFKDQARNANYGFIQHAKLGDLFFHGSSIELRSVEQGQSVDPFRENEIVVFHIKDSKKYTGKLEAINVKLLTDENNLIFLFNHFIYILTEKNAYSDYNLIQKGVNDRIEELIKKNSDEIITKQLFENFINYVNSVIQSADKINYEIIKSIFKICKKYFSEDYIQISNLIENKIPEKLAHQFWLEEYLDTCQVDYIASVILIETQQRKSIIFRKCSTKDKLNIFFKIIYNIEQVDTEQKLETIKSLIKLSEEFNSDQHEKTVVSVLEYCPPHYKLNLWLEDYHDVLEYGLFKPYIITLIPQQQKRFVKKVLKYIHEEKVLISIHDFTSLNVMDYETSKLTQESDQSYLDYSTSIILNVVSGLHNQLSINNRKEANEAQYKIYDLILKQIKEPKDILQITGYFDECTGRCSATVNEEKNAEGEVVNRNVNYNRKERDKPRFHPICDGRKATSKDTGEPILSDDNKLEYWWCANQKCFKPSRELHKSSDWEKYTLLDVLSILKINFREIDLEIYLNIINKANRFLKHLKCRECSHILYPIGKTQYAFYGVSNFCCKNTECLAQSSEIYLSHCLNGFCEMEIDSRDAVKCKPVGVDPEMCGWYVCNNCHSCCSNKQLENRKWVYDNILHKEYKCHLKGHKELGVISCNKCGDSMESGRTNVEEFQRILTWFIDNDGKSERIYKSGKNKLGKRWFVIKRGKDSYEKFREILTKYHQIGFQIPDYNIDKDLQLISEPINFEKRGGDVLTCKSCGHSIDLSNDLERAKAIKSFHKNRFTPESTEI